MLIKTFMPKQREMAQFIRDHNGSALLAAAPGTGKTLVGIRIARLPCLVICRRDDYLTWRLQLEEEEEPSNSIWYLEYADQELPKIGDHSWFIVSYDLAKNPRISLWIRASLFAQVIADECHYLKRWASKRTKSIVRSNAQIPRRLGMSGSAITNSPIDLFSQCLFVDGGKTFGKNEWLFKHEYYIHEGFGWYLKRNSKDRIAQKLKNIAYYVHEDEVMKLPPPMTIIKGVPMTGQQRRMYEQVLNDWEAEIEGKVVEYDQVVVQLQKLKQLASGFIYDEQGKPVYVKCRKYDWLFDILKDPDQLGNKPKVVVWGSFTAELEYMARMAVEKKINHVSFYGKISRKKREEARFRFRDDPDCRLFFGQVDRGVGMNELIGADTAVYMSNSHKVVSKQQSKRRIRRKGSEIHERITYYECVTEGTVDLPLLRSIGTAMNLADMIFRELKKGKPLRTLLT